MTKETFQPAKTVEEARVVVGKLGYPVLVRPAFVPRGALGDDGFVVCSGGELERILQDAFRLSPTKEVGIRKWTSKI